MDSTQVLHEQTPSNSNFSTDKLTIAAKPLHAPNILFHLLKKPFPALSAGLAFAFPQGPEYSTLSCHLLCSTSYWMPCGLLTRCATLYGPYLVSSNRLNFNKQ